VAKRFVGFVATLGRGFVDSLVNETDDWFPIVEKIKVFALRILPFVVGKGGSRDCDGERE
jgi:hypothetical protein